MRIIPCLLIAFVVVPGCNCGQVGSEDEARIAYLGVDSIVTRALDLGFAGFNAADSANIPAQSAEGDEGGTIAITGQVDQGASDNKGMRLEAALTEYTDGPIDDPETEDEEELDIVYATAEGAPLLVGLSLRDIPDGTMTGTIVGTVAMTGELEGELELNIAISGAIESDGNGGDGTQRVEGSTEVTGTATSANGTFDVDTSI